MGMAVGSGGAGGGRRGRGRVRKGPMSEMNMTPFIDVMLVLLIIFMVAAPLLATGVPIDLPQTKAAPLNIEKKPIAIAIDDKGELYLMDQPVKIEELIARIQPLAAGGTEERIYIRGARAVNYGRVAEVMALVTGAGYKKVALVTEPEKK